MEKFVTDLDKLLDEFENEDLSSNHIYEFSDSSGYNSLKTSTELYPTDTTIERNTTQLSEMNEITELPTPTCSEPNITDLINTNINNVYENVAQQTQIKEHNNYFQNDSECNNTGLISMNNENNIISLNQTDSIFNQHDNSLIKSPVHSNVPPKKKLRPSSLFGITSITSADENIEPTSFHPIQIVCNNAENPSHLSIESALPSKKPIKRPLTLNIMSPEISDNRVPNIQITDENLVPILESVSDLSQVAENESPQLSKDEKEISDDSNISWQGIPIEELGYKEPTWIKDEITNNCMECQLPFTMFRRRHHCRACGRLLCGKCCCWRMQLQFSSRFFPKDRVCAVCFQYLIRLEVAKKHNQNLTISNLQPHNSVLKPSSRPQSLAVSPFSNSDNLSMSDSLNNSNTVKSVIFSDGIRPGGDLMENEKSRIITPTKYQSPRITSMQNVPLPPLNSREPAVFNLDDSATILPPLVVEYRDKLVMNNDLDNLAQQTRITEHNPVILAITRNLHIHLEIIQLTYCTCIANHTHNSNIQQGCEYECIECWYFASIGLETIGCEEVVIILKKLPNESCPPNEIFQYYFHIYQRAFKNETKNDDLEMTIELFSSANVNFKDWAGILHIRPTFQCLDKLPLPCSSFLIGILIHRWELPWAKILPLRLLLALGNQSRFYPCSIISDRYRSSVYVEISQTILQLISPVFSFPNNLEQGYIDPHSLPTVPGMWIHLLASQETIIQIPKLSYKIILEIMSYHRSELNTLALVACFSREADSHLVCCQNEDSCKYFSGAISIQHTERTVTGATMIIFIVSDDSTELGATIVEDVLVVRLSSIQLSCVINSLKTMSNLILQWDSAASAESTNKSFIKIVWTDSHQFSEMATIERPSLVTDETIQSAFLHSTYEENETIKSQRVPSSLQDITVDQATLNNINLKLMWTRFHYCLSENVFNDSFNDDALDVEDIIRNVAIHFSRSLTPFLESLRESGLVNFGLRISINKDTINFLVGCSKKILYSTLTPDQSPMEDHDSNQSSYIYSKMGNSRKFHSLSFCALPDICNDSLNETLVPFLYSQTALIRSGSVTAELEFHIID